MPLVLAICSGGAKGKAHLPLRHRRMDSAVSPAMGSEACPSPGDGATRPCNPNSSISHIQDSQRRAERGEARSWPNVTEGSPQASTSARHIRACWVRRILSYRPPFHCDYVHVRRADDMTVVEFSSRRQAVPASANRSMLPLAHPHTCT